MKVNRISDCQAVPRVGAERLRQVQGPDRTRPDEGSSPPPNVRLRAAQQPAPFPPCAASNAPGVRRRRLKLSLVAAIGAHAGVHRLPGRDALRLRRPPSWSEELALLMFTWTIAGRSGARRARGLPCAAGPAARPAAGRRAGVWAERAIDALTAAFGAYLAWSGWRFFDDHRRLGLGRDRLSDRDPACARAVAAA